MKILIPTDFSRNAFKAFEYGADVFAWTNPELILVNIQNARHAGSMMSLDLNQELMAAANKDMEDELKVCKKAYPNLQIRGIVTAGTFTDSVLEISEENNIDIIIVFGLVKTKEESSCEPIGIFNPNPSDISVLLSSFVRL